MNKIGRYEIIRPFARGGMARVYLAYDSRFEREVAIKVMDLVAGRDRIFRQRFDREAKFIASLEHPAIVPVYDFGQEGGQPYLVMRFMSGGSLANRLRRGPLSLDEATQLLQRLAPALDEAHKAGILHRDLKPGNILFDQRNFPYLSDFGIARPMQQTKDGLTQVGSLLGTPAYMSPEQARGLSDLDGRSDIYALGVILFQMLTGHVPYQADTPVQQALKQVTEPVPRLSQIKPGFPPICEIVIARAMAKEPAHRYATASEMVSELKAGADKRISGSWHSPSEPPTEVQAIYDLLDGQGHRYSIGARQLTIGREPTNDIHIRNDDQVSRLHAVITLINNRCVVYDKRSTNGTFINEQAVSEQGMDLTVGDRLKIGNSRFQLRRVSQPLPPLAKAPHPQSDVPFYRTTSSPPKLSSEPASRIANMTMMLTRQMSKKMESMSNGQVMVLVMATIGGFVLVTWLVGDFISVNLPGLWYNFPVYYLAAPVVRVISNRKGTAFGVHLVLHMVMAPLVYNQPNYLGYFISALVGGAILEGSFMIPNVPDWLRFPLAIFVAYAVTLLILGGSTEQIALASVSGAVIGGLAYAIVESYKGYRKGRLST